MSGLTRSDRSSGRIGSDGLCVTLDGTSLSAPSADRVAWSRNRMSALRDSVGDWFSVRRGDQRFARFGVHFNVLEAVLVRMLEAIDKELAGIGVASDGQVYEQCRASDYRLSLIRRIHQWYAGKYDQRVDERLAPTLLAADEIVRSCWSQPFAVIGRNPPTGPLVYLDSRFDAFATPRVSVPPDLRAPGDTVVGKCVLELPIPVVALPATSVDEPWWLVLAAHETGHHVHRDLDAGFVQATRDTLQTATSAPPGSADLAAHWQAWALETFADAFALLMVGTAGAWAVDELQYGDPSRMVFVPQAGERYPPPAVRTALLGELARHAGLPDPGPGVLEVRAWLESLPCEQVGVAARVAVAAHLAVVEPAAQALIDVAVGGHRLRDLCAWTPDRFANGGSVERWSGWLTATAPTVTGRSAREAARLGIAGGVAAYRSNRVGSGELARLRANLPVQLAQCGPPGHLAGEPAVAIGAVAERLAGLVLGAVPERSRA